MDEAQDLCYKNRRGSKNIYIFGIFLITIYLLSQVFPPLFVLDVTSMKHYVFAILNSIAIIFLLVYTIRDRQSFSSLIFKNIISYSWLLLIGMMFLSFFQSINLAESIVTVNRWMIVYLMFIYFSVFLSTKPTLFNFIVKLTLFIAIIHILWVVIGYYYYGANYNPRRNLNISGFNGNKNIFAAIILFKLPFLYYAFILRRNWEKYLSIILVFGLSFSLVILSARTSFIGFILLLILVLGYSIFVVLKFNRPRKFIISAVIIIVVSLLGFFAGDTFIKYNFNKYCIESNLGDTFEEGVNPYSVSSRLKSIEERNSKGRLKIWRNTITIIKDKPLLGYGVGNHKLAIMKVEAAQKTNFVVSDHAHNDYLEMWSELGIFGLISYLLLFSCSLVLFVKTLISKNISDVTRFTSFVGFLCIVIYMNDAIFNFPLERAECQLYLALGMSLILVSYLKMRKTSEIIPVNKIIILIAIFSLGLITVETMHYVSSIMQKARMLQPKGNNMVSLNAEQWDRFFPPIPTIDENAYPIAMAKGMRYDAEQRYREAVDVIIDDRSNPYFGLREYRLSIYYLKMNMLDSSEYWARKSMAIKPISYYPVEVLYRKYTVLEEYNVADTIIRSFISRYKFNANAWLDLYDVSIRQGFDDESLRVIDSALLYMPNNSSIRNKHRDITSN